MALLDIKRDYSSAVRDAGVDNLSFHDLLHTWSTRAEGLGVPEAVGRDILCHSPGTMTASYTHSNGGEGAGRRDGLRVGAAQTGEAA